MSINCVVTNSSPLIVLFKSQQAELLPQLFSEILVPQAVWDEVTVAGQNDTASQQLASVSWAQQVEIGAIAPEVAAWDLGKGESEVLSLALKTPDCVALIDDKAARRCSQVLGIITLGTGGLLLLAKRRGLIPLVVPKIHALRDAGLWLSEYLVNLLKQQAGE
jgi:predicted nucleic acid-binding protein